MSTLKVNDIQTITGTPNRGKILQVVQLTYASKSTNASISVFTDTPFGTLTITPSSTSSRILLSTTFGYGISPGTTCIFRFTRNGTPVGTSGVDLNASFGTGGSNNDAWRECVSFQYLDSPATTSTLSYKIQFLPYDTGRTVYWNDTPSGGGVDDATGVTTFIAMEVAG
jgi:hypothetical protein